MRGSLLVILCVIMSAGCSDDPVGAVDAAFDAQPGDAAGDGSWAGEGGASVCTRVGRSYGAFEGAEGPRCPASQANDKCLPGDTCIADGLCEVVLSREDGPGPCDWQGQSYDPYESAEGPDCPPDQSYDECLPGDLCLENRCEVVLSKPEGTRDASCTGLEYSAYEGGAGPNCPPSQAYDECFPGDSCTGDGLCTAGLSCQEKSVDPSTFGTEYAPYDSAEGPDCPPTQTHAECLPGDLCTETAMCKVVLSGGP